MNSGKPNIIEEVNKPTFNIESYTPSVFLANTASAGAVALAISIPISIIDYSIMSKVAGTSPSISHGIINGTKTFLFKPHRFFFKLSPDKMENSRAVIYRVVGTVYFFTYLSNNITWSWMSAHGYSKEENEWARGIMSGLVNTALTVWKDSVILQLLPSQATGGSSSSSISSKQLAYVPIVSRLGFCMRDMLTCIAAFTLVPMFARYLNDKKTNPNSEPILPKSMGLNNDKLSALTVPAALQTVTTVLHIGSIRYQRTYPNPSVGDFMSALRKDYVGAVIARVGRIVPAFGIGSIGNKALMETSVDWATRSE